MAEESLFIHLSHFGLSYCSTSTFQNELQVEIASRKRKKNAWVPKCSIVCVTLFSVAGNILSCTTVIFK